LKYLFNKWNFDILPCKIINVNGVFKTLNRK